MVNETFAILKLLIENQEEKFSIRKISKLRKINYKSAYNAIQKLEQRGIITVNKLGNHNVCSFKKRFDDLVFSVENSRKELLLKKNKDFKVLCQDLAKISSQFIVILFGSHATGTAKKNSDMDLLVITEDVKQIQGKLSLLPLEIHLVDINYTEFIKMLKSKELTVVSEAIKKNIILFGIEDYYRLLNNAK